MNFQIVHEGVQTLLCAFQINLDAFFAIQNPAGEGVFASQPVDKRAEPNTLHHAGDLKLAADGRAPALRVFFLGWHCIDQTLVY